MLLKAYFACLFLQFSCRSLFIISSKKPQRMGDISEMINLIFKENSLPENLNYLWKWDINLEVCSLKQERGGFIRKNMFIFIWQIY